MLLVNCILINSRLIYEPNIIDVLISNLVSVMSCQLSSSCAQWSKESAIIIINMNSYPQGTLKYGNIVVLCLTDMTHKMQLMFKGLINN